MPHTVKQRESVEGASTFRTLLRCINGKNMLIWEQCLLRLAYCLFKQEDTKLCPFYIFTITLTHVATFRPWGAKCRVATMQVNSFNTHCLLYWSLKVTSDQRLHANEERRRTGIKLVQAIFCLNNTTKPPPPWPPFTRTQACIKRFIPELTVTVCARMFSQCPFRFPPVSQKHTSDYNKLPLGLNGCVYCGEWLVLHPGCIHAYAPRMADQLKLFTEACAINSVPIWSRIPHFDAHDAHVLRSYRLYFPRSLRRAH